MSSFQWSPLGGSGGGVNTYANLAAFPSAASAGAGALAIALDTGFLYESISSVWTAIASPGGALSITTFGSTPNANGLTLSSGVLNMQPADATHSGGLSSTDWNTFNNKQASGNYITALTGDGTAAGPGSVALTLATVNSNVGSFGSSTSIPSFTVNAKGLITAASGNAVIAPAGTLTGTTLASNVVTSSLTSLGAQAAALNMNSHLINSVTDPVSAQDAATKSYVDASVAALQPQASVYAASTANIAGTYSNGVAGVGATFTTTATTAFALDGTSPALTYRVLLKDQTSGFQNGVYNLTTQAVNGVSGAILTRSLDYNTASDMNNAGLIPVLNGTVNALSSWQQVAVITTVGSDSLTFTEFTANPSLYLLKANNLSDVASSSSSFNNISGLTTLGDLIYGGASGTRSRLAGNITTTLQVLSQTGNGSVSAAPVWTSAVSTSTASTLVLRDGSNNFAAGTLTLVGASFSGLTASQVVVTDGSKNLASLAYATAATATTLCERDSNANITTNSFIQGYTTTATAAGTTTLTVGSTQQQYFTGSTTQTVTMPVTSTLVTGQQWFIINNSTGIVTVNSSGGNQIVQLAASTGAMFTCILTSGTNAASWSYSVLGAGGAVYPTVQIFTSGTDQTYTTPANCIYIVVEQVGGGGGGGASGTAGGGAATTGNSTIWKTSGGTAIVTSGGGINGVLEGGSGGAGGTNTFAAGATKLADIPGGGGGGSTGYIQASTGGFGGPIGGSSHFGGAAPGSSTAAAGNNGSANAGGGGSGGGTANQGASNCVAGSGGGGGAYARFLITAPSATYHYTVAATAAGGTLGTNGTAGGNGSAGMIIVTEYYANGAIGTATNITGIAAKANGGTGNAGAVPAAKTTTYSILTTDNVILVDGTSAGFTTTLPTAVGLTGQQFTIKRVDQTLANAVTIATTSSQTIDGVTTRKLMTQYEQFTVVSDGANWQVLSHTYPSTWTAYTPTFTGLGTVTNNGTYWRRVGNSMEVNSFFTTGTATAVVAKVSFPSGLTIDTSSVVAGTTSAGRGNQASSTSDLIVLSDTTATTVFEFADIANGTNFTAQNGSAAFSNATNSAFLASVPIANWEP